DPQAPMAEAAAGLAAGGFRRRFGAVHVGRVWHFGLYAPGSVFWTCGLASPALRPVRALSPEGRTVSARPRERLLLHDAPPDGAGWIDDDVAHVGPEDRRLRVRLADDGARLPCGSVLAHDRDGEARNVDEHEAFREVVHHPAGALQGSADLVDACGDGDV